MLVNKNIQHLLQNCDMSNEKSKLPTIWGDPEKFSTWATSQNLTKYQNFLGVPFWSGWELFSTQLYNQFLLITTLERVQKKSVIDILFSSPSFETEILIKSNKVQ